MKRAVTTIVVIGTIGIGYSVCAATVHLSSDDPPRLLTVHIVVLTALAIAFLAACGWAFVLRIEAGQRRIIDEVAKDHAARMTRLETEQAAASARATRRYEVIRTALVSLGAEIAENTGEIRRVTATAPAPAAWPIDPTTNRLLGELDAELRRREIGQ